MVLEGPTNNILVFNGPENVFFVSLWTLVSLF